MDKALAFIVCLSKIYGVCTIIAYFRESAWERRMKEADAIIALRKAETEKQIAEAGNRVRREMLLERFRTDMKQPSPPLRKATGVFSDAAAQAAVK